MNPAKPHSAGAFDGLRLAAAIAVIFGHSFALTGHDAEEPIAQMTSGKVTIGEIAVTMFFAISGYLVTQSWLRDSSIKRFIMRRLLRIIPALALVISISALCIGALLTTLNPGDYFHARETWGYLEKIFIYPAQYGLPGVFEHNPLPFIINGSLWTLRLEFALYIVIAGMGLLGCLRWRWFGIILSLLCVAAFTVLSNDILPAPHQIVVLFANAAPFLMGAGLAQFNLNSKPLWLCASLITLATAALMATPSFRAVLLLALPIITILIARFGHCDLSRFGDYSYGTYLWGFVVQQIIVTEMPDILPLKLFCFATPPTLIVAAVSWHMIEKPALTLKPKKQIISQ